MANLLFYKNPVPLNKTEHQNKKIKAEGQSFAFAGKTNSVILAGVEFSEAAKEYPIVFAEAGESVIPVAMLGLRNEENLYVDDKGKWDARYIPAFVRRYPFVLAQAGESDQRVVCIDETFEGFNDDEGEPLFEGEEPSPLLKKALDFLTEYQNQYLRTEAFVMRLRENDLLMALNAKIDMTDGQQFAMTGLLAVDERKLLQLADDKALELFRSGELSWIYCHLMSLGSMGRMVDRIAERSKAEPKKTAEPEPSADAKVEKAKAKAKARKKQAD
jgi:hypothetical protein